MTGITSHNDWGCQGAECFSKPWPNLYRYCYFYWLVDFTRNVKTLPSASFNSFTKTMGLMGFIEALRLKKEGIISIISNQGAVSNELFKENLIF